MKKQPDWIELEIPGIIHSRKRNLFIKLFNRPTDYSLLLCDKANRNRQFQIQINQLEGQGIAIALEKMIPGRPLIQDLFKTAVEMFNSKLEYVLINKSDDEGYIYSLMSLSTLESPINARPADAIAMALRFECPIYVTRDVFEKLAKDI